MSLGCGAFVTGPLMRLGRAAAGWDAIACSDEEWRRAADALRERAATGGSEVSLSIYPWDILTEIETRLESPQAMLLVVPNGKVKLLNALPFSPADLRRDSLESAWNKYRDAWRYGRSARIRGRVPVQSRAAEARERNLADGRNGRIRRRGNALLIA